MEIKEKIYKIIFKFCRFCVRSFTPRYQVYDTKDSASPAVYIVHHQNLRGPITSILWFNTNIRPWILSVFCNQRTCFRQYYDYTFTKRFGMPKVIAAIIAFPLSYFISGIMRLIQAIPVFRDSKAIIKTCKQSISTLTKGQSLLICPDIDYTNTSSNMAEMYTGFLNLDKYYMKQTGKHLAFVPLHISKNKRGIYVGEAVYFNEGSDFKQEKIKVNERLKQEFLRLEREAC